jgi:hypothetical protein
MVGPALMHGQTDERRTPTVIERLEDMEGALREVREARNRVEAECSRLRSWAWAWGLTAVITGWMAVIVAVFCFLSEH